MLAGKGLTDKGLRPEASPCLPQAKPLFSPAMKSWPWMVSTVGFSQPSLPGCRKLTALPWSGCSVLSRWIRYRQGLRSGSVWLGSLLVPPGWEKPVMSLNISSGHWSGQLGAKYGLSRVHWGFPEPRVSYRLGEQWVGPCFCPP